MNPPFQIIGQGLAGTCLAWALFERDVSFELLDREQGGSSRVAAGMINPVTGKRFEPSWRVDEFLPEAIAFYESLERKLGERFWHPLAVIRLTTDRKDRAKAESKLEDPTVRTWLSGEVIPPPGDWSGAFELRGGGRLDVRALLDASRRFFQERGIYRRAETNPEELFNGERVWCEGASGLLTGTLGQHRCAKGEILTVRAIGWSEPRILIGGGGWLVPVGGDRYKVGATYEWDRLDETPTEEGRAKVEAILRRLAPGPFEVIDHEAGVRPILRRSQPLIGKIGDEWFFNGLGSKGSLYAPGVAKRLASWLIDGTEPEADFNLANFLNQNVTDEPV